MGVRVREMDQGGIAMAEAQEDYIRIFYQNEAGGGDAYPYTPAYDVKGGNWKVANTGDNISECSGVAYGFVYELFYSFVSEGKEVPVAIMNTQKGGSSIHSWLPREVVVGTKPIYDYVVTKKGFCPDESYWNQNGAQNYNQISALYNSRIAPLFNFNIAGVLWYQGENDPMYDPTIYSIRALVDSWSKGFNRNDEKLNFCLVQVHPYDGTDPFLGPSEKNYTSFGYAEHRLAQLNVAMDEEYKDNVTLIPIYDVSLLWDVPKTQFQWKSVVHPVVKRPIGERAGKAAWSKYYVGDNKYVAPIYSSHTYTDNTITIKFENVGHGLKTFKNSELGVTTVEVVLINGSRVTVNCKVISKDEILITGVQTNVVEYISYSNFIRNEESNLSSSYGVPALPFKIQFK